MARGKSDIKTCDYCKVVIPIDRHKIDEIVLFKSKYYHDDCFKKMCMDKMASKRSKLNWKEILEDISSFKEDAKKTLELVVARDELNEYLINTYDVTAIPGSFWSMVSDLGNGSYRQKKCKPVPTRMLLDTWKWGQHHLDKIAAKNKTNNRGPINGEQRIRYDFAIVIRHIDDYKKHIAETKEQAEIVTKHTENKNRINYEQLYAQSNHQNISESIIDLMNEIF